MSGYQKNLIHDESCFLRETLESRMKLYGLGNIVRLELFLWDLEIFLQIQEILKGRVVLKGGAAVQFYLPVEIQRTSVDIDMIFCGTKDEILSALKVIENKLGADDRYFRFREHVPNAPKTELSLYTFFLPIPSVCYENELRVNTGKQEIKVEFISYPCKIEISKVTGQRIFAVESDKEYNVLPLNNLLADKLTTLGPKSIGIQDERMDEQIKQLFDIHALMIFNMDALNFDIIREKYMERAKIEADSRKIGFNESNIIADALTQLRRLSKIDDGEDKELKKHINDFQSSYIVRNGRKSRAEWAVVGEQIKYLMELIFIHKMSKSKLQKAFEIESLLSFRHLSGADRGRNILEFKNILIREYASYSIIDPKILKGKSPSRIFWSILTPENIDQIEYFVNDHIVRV